MSKLLIILAPPRSYSSIVATQIGQHPDLYGFPELRLFTGNTIAEIIDIAEKRTSNCFSGLAGLLRSLAQLHEGIQTDSAVTNSWRWLQDRKHWSTKDVFSYLLKQVSPKMGVEKTPQTCMKTQYLERAYSFFPQAYYMHLTRHPVSTRASILVNNQAKKNVSSSAKKNIRQANQVLDPIYRWHRIHSDIINLTDRFPAGRTLRMKGEDLLAEPDIFLPVIAEWLGVSTDNAAIAAMKHPENSPYACIGPAIAMGGNNLDFLRNPHLRVRKKQEPSLSEFWKNHNQKLTDELNYNNDLELDMAAEVTMLANQMGYQ